VPANSTGTARCRALPAPAAVCVPCPSRPGGDGRHLRRPANDGPTSPRRRSSRPSATMEYSAVACRGLRAVTLRRLLAREAPGEIVRRPSKSTLHEDLTALRAASRDQKPQHPGRGRLREPRQRCRLPGGPAAVRRRAGGQGRRSSGVRPGRACHVPGPRDQAVPAAAPRRKLTLRTAATLAYAAVPGLAGQG
jgi:hypothetical protein